jgi:heme A synthase
MKCFVWRRIWQIEVEHVTLIHYVVAICMLTIVVLSTTWTTQRQDKACPLESHEVYRWKSSENFQCLVFGFHKN